MKLSEAIHIIRTEYNYARVEMEDSTPETPTRMRLILVSMGEFRAEEFMSQLQNSIFGQLYLDSQHRGGRDEYVIPVGEMGQERDWFTLTTPNPNPVSPFSNMDTEEYEMVAVPTVKYVYVKKVDPRREISWKMRGFLETLVGEYGKETVEEALDRSLTVSSFYGDSQLKATLEFR